MTITDWIKKSEVTLFFSTNNLLIFYILTDCLDSFGCKALFWGLFSLFSGVCTIFHGFCRCVQKVEDINMINNYSR